MNNSLWNTNKQTENGLPNVSKFKIISSIFNIIYPCIAKPQMSIFEM